jgi:hypothetical protein
MSCVSRDVLVANTEGAATRIAGTTRLPRGSAGFVTLVVRYRFAVTADGGRPAGERWQARTLGYEYRLDDLDGREIVAFHWHPEGRSHVQIPHLHLGAALGGLRPEMTKAHLHTGRLTPVAVLSLVIERFGVRPRRPDWRTILEQADQILVTM